jgi:hypothetical protein
MDKPLHSHLSEDVDQNIISVVEAAMKGREGNLNLRAYLVNQFSSIPAQEVTSTVATLLIRAYDDELMIKFMLELEHRLKSEMESGMKSRQQESAIYKIRAMFWEGKFHTYDEILDISQAFHAAEPLTDSAAKHLLLNDAKFWLDPSTLDLSDFSDVTYFSDDERMSRIEYDESTDSMWILPARTSIDRSYLESVVSPWLTTTQRKALVAQLAALRSGAHVAGRKKSLPALRSRSAVALKYLTNAAEILAKRENQRLVFTKGGFVFNRLKLTLHGKDCHGNVDLVGRCVGGAPEAHWGSVRVLVDMRTSSKPADLERQRRMRAAMACEGLRQRIAVEKEAAIGWACEEGRVLFTEPPR